MSKKMKLSKNEKEAIVAILESNFKDCLNHLHRYITSTLLISVIYLAIVVTPQQIEIPGVPVKLEGGFAFVLLTAFYIAIGGMATYVAERANNIARTLYEYQKERTEALRLSPSIGTTDIPGVRFIVSFVPSAILGLHLAYLGYQESNWVFGVPIAFVASVGFTLWTLLPIGATLEDTL